MSGSKRVGEPDYTLSCATAHLAGGNLFFFTLGYTTTLSLLEIILLEIAFPKAKLALFTWTPKEEPADQIKKEIVTARFIELVPKSAT